MELRHFHEINLFVVGIVSFAAAEVLFSGDRELFGILLVSDVVLIHAALIHVARSDLRSFRWFFLEMFGILMTASFLYVLEEARCSRGWVLFPGLLLIVLPALKCGRAIRRE